MYKYAWIYLNKQSSEYARILNVSDAVPSIRPLYKLSRQTYLEHWQTFKTEPFAKRIIAECMLKRKK